MQNHSIGFSTDFAIFLLFSIILHVFWNCFITLMVISSKPACCQGPQWVIACRLRQVFAERVLHNTDFLYYIILIALVQNLNTKQMFLANGLVKKRETLCLHNFWLIHAVFLNIYRFLHWALFTVTSFFFLAGYSAPNPSCRYTMSACTCSSGRAHVSSSSQTSHAYVFKTKSAFSSTQMKRIRHR